MTGKKGQSFKTSRQTKIVRLFLISDKTAIFRLMAVWMIVFYLPGCVSVNARLSKDQTFSDNPYHDFLIGMDHKIKGEQLKTEGERLDDAVMKEKSRLEYLLAAERFSKVVDSDPAVGVAWEELVTCLVQADEDTRARKRIKKALAAGIESVTILEMLGDFYLADQDYKAAEETFTRVGQIAPGSLLAGLKLAELKEKKGDRKDAVRILETLRPYPGRTESRILHWKARLLAIDDCWLEALDAVSEAIESRPSSFECNLFQADLLERMGRIMQARDRYLKTLSIYPFDRAILRKTSRICATMEDLQCIIFLSKVFEETEAGDDPWALYLKVAELLLTGSPDSADSLLSSRVGDFGDDTDFHYWVGRVKEKSDLSADAEIAYRVALAIEPGNTDVLAALTSLLAGQDRFNEAVELLRRGIAYNREDPLIRYLLGLVSYVVGRFEESRDNLLDARALGYVRNETLESNLGATFEALGQFDEAIESFNLVIEINPMNHEALNYVAYMYAEQGVNLDEGLALAVRADSLNPENSYILDTIAWLQYKSGLFQDALAYITKAVEIHHDPVIMLHAGDIMRALGREEEAEEYWWRALEASRGEGNREDILD